MFFDKTVFVSRLALDSDNTNKESYVTHSGFQGNAGKTAAIKVNIQPATPELTALADGQVFKTYKCFTANSGIVETMRLTVSGTNEIYTVRGREVFDYGIEKHYELVLEKNES